MGNKLEEGGGGSGGLAGGNFLGKKKESFHKSKKIMVGDPPRQPKDQRGTFGKRKRCMDWGMAKVRRGGKKR